MNPFLRRLLLLALPLAAAWVPAQAQVDPTQESLATVGVTSVGAGRTWAYLVWTTNVPELLDARTYAIYQKSGNAASASPYQRVAIVQVQIDPSAIGGLIERAQLALGEDTSVLDNMVANLFQNVIPASEVTTADRISAVMQAAFADPETLKNLMIAAKTFPSLSMALGRAHVLPIPGVGVQTFEVREYNPATAADVAVVGRTTVNPLTPLGLPGLLTAPSVLVEPPLNPAIGKNNLAIRFVWDTPPAFRQVALLAHGFNLYRVRRPFAESNGLHLAAPTGAMLSTFAATAPVEVQRVNNVPITPNVNLTAAEVAAVTHETVFFIDEETKFPGYPSSHVKPKNGDQFYYFVTPRDLLGRDIHSASSPGLLATFCDRMPPPTPKGLVVTNDYSFSGGSSVQKLKLTWPANPVVDGKATTAYFIYRWENPSDVYQLGGNPVANLIHGPVFQVPGQSTYSYVDAGGGSPSMPADTGKTFWYTVRAVDDGSFDPPGAEGPFCAVAPFGGNVSGHSPPAFGVLRDRVGPARPEGGIEILCPDVLVRADPKVGFERDGGGDTTRHRLRVKIAKAPNDPNYDWAEIYHVSTTVKFIGRFDFVPEQEALTVNFTLPWDLNDQENSIRVRVGLSNGKVSNYAQVSFSKPNTFDGIHLFDFTATITYNRIDTRQLSGRPGDCTGHVIPPGGSLPPGDSPGIKIPFFPPLGTTQWKLYTRIDGGSMTLAREDSGTFDPAVQEEILFENFPAVQSRICFFLQVFDINGNPSPMQDRGCVEVEGTQEMPTPMLAPLIPTGDDGSETALINWFCAPYGVDHFEVWISSEPTQPEDDLDGPSRAIFERNQDWPLPNNVTETEGGSSVTRSYKVYNTERIGPLFGNGANFDALVEATPGATWRIKVRAVSAMGLAGPFSNPVDFTWTLPEPLTGPDVPWPKRPLPALNTTFLAAEMIAEWLPLEDAAGVRIGRAQGRFEYDQKDKVYALFNTLPIENHLYTASLDGGTERTVLPVVLYRIQETDPAGLYPASGDIIQVSPLIETIADSTVVPPGGAATRVIHDPFIAARSETLPNPTGTVSYIYLMDTQPQIGGARYRYLVVLLDPLTREVSAVIPTGTIDIPSL